MTNKYNVRACLGIIPIVFALMICIVPFITSNAFAAGGLSGANIKDGVLQGYYGDGGDIVLPNTVTSIAGEAFKNNDNVTSITIPGSVSSIGYSAFEGCTALEKVVFSDPKDGAELTIRVNAFQDCTKLSDITIPACCTYVTANIFKGCTSLEEIKVDEIVVNCIEVNKIDTIEIEVTSINDEFVYLAYKNFVSFYGDDFKFLI